MRILFGLQLTNLKYTMQHDSTSTSLPAGETLVECAMRESMEETGLALRNNTATAGTMLGCSGSA